MTIIKKRRVSMYKILVGLILLSTVGLSIVGLSSCSVIPEPPTTKLPVDPPEIELSTLEARVAAPYAVIAQELNRVIPNQLHWATGQPISHCPVSECSYQVRVLRNGDISVGHDGNGRLVVNLPIRTADGRIDAMKRVLGARVRKHADFAANVTATATLGSRCSRIGLQYLKCNSPSMCTVQRRALVFLVVV